MIQVSVLYPNPPGVRFDHAYYKDKHMPMVKAKLGPACLYYTVERGLAGGTPDSPPTYVAQCHIYSESVESFSEAFGANAKEILGDIPNYTDQEPVLQINEVVIERG